MKLARLQIRNNPGVNNVYNEFLHHFERTQGYIENLKYNNDMLIYGVLDSFGKNHMKTIM